MYIRGKGEVFLLDRDNSVFSCSLLSFPARAQGAHISDTLLDGVMRERERERESTEIVDPSHSPCAGTG